jgi:hypothetical protein
MDETEQEIQAFLREYPDAGRDLTLLINGYRELAYAALNTLREESGEDIADGMISLSWKDTTLEGYGIPVLKKPLDWHNYRMKKEKQMNDKTPIGTAEEPPHPLYVTLWRIAVAFEEQNQINREWIERQKEWREADVSAYEARQSQETAYLKVIEHRHQHESLLFGLARANHAILLTRCQGLLTKYQKMCSVSEDEAVSQVLRDVERSLSQFQLIEMMDIKP